MKPPSDLKCIELCKDYHPFLTKYLRNVAVCVASGLYCNERLANPDDLSLYEVLEPLGFFEAIDALNSGGSQSSDGWPSNVLDPCSLFLNDTWGSSSE